jgi:cysteine desulfurase
MELRTDPIYLDYNATTPVAPEVVEAVVGALRESWGNLSSVHAYGVRARHAVEQARTQVAELIGSGPDEVMFTSGGTEADNAALFGVTEALRDRGRHLIVSAVEHPAVAAVCDELSARGFGVTRVPVDSEGRVRPADVEAAIQPDTVLISVMHAQNETGVIQPIAEISARARPRGIVVHSDTAQSVGKIPVNVDALGVDLLTVAGHKLYAPKGVGALYLRHTTPFSPFLRGAGHESGRRAGTENTPAIVGLGAACALATSEMDQRQAHLAALRDRLQAALLDAFPDLVIHGQGAERLPNTLSTAIPGVRADPLFAALPGIATAAGSACDAGAGDGHVSAALSAMGVSDDIARCTMRLTVGRPTTTDEIDRAAAAIVQAARSTRHR